jgi:hypothetical protein
MSACLLAGLACAGLAGQAMAQDAEITASLVTSPAPLLTVGSTFDVDIAVTSNNSALSNVPMSAGINLYYNSAQVTFVDAVGVDLGAVSYTGEITGYGVYAGKKARVITAAGNAANTDATPVICDITFQTIASPPAAYDILFTDGFDAARPVASVDNLMLDRVYDNSDTTFGTADTPPSAPASGVVVKSSVTAGDPSVGSSQFTVRLEISDNTIVPSEVIPSIASIRLEFDDSLISPSAIVAPDLTDYLVGLGPIEGTSPNNTCDILISLPSNTSPTPDLCTLTFDVTGTGTAALGLSADPGAAKNFAGAINQTLPANPSFQTVVVDISESYVGVSPIAADVTDWTLLQD